MHAELRQLDFKLKKARQVGAWLGSSAGPETACQRDRLVRL